MLYEHMFTFFTMAVSSFIEVAFSDSGNGVPGTLRGGVAAVKIVRVQGDVGGYLSGIAAGDVLFLGGGGDFALRKTPSGTLLLAPVGGGGGAQEGAAQVGVAGIMKKMSAPGRR
jgi:hypothetical protein